MEKMTVGRLKEILSLYPEDKIITSRIILIDDECGDVVIYPKILGIIEDESSVSIIGEDGS